MKTVVYVENRCDANHRKIKEKWRTVVSDKKVINMEIPDLYSIPDSSSSEEE